MKEIILSVSAVILCIPIIVVLIKHFIVDVYKAYDDGTYKGKAEAMLKSIISGLIIVAILALVGMCANSDPEHNERWDEYQERREPKW